MMNVVAAAVSALAIAGFSHVAQEPAGGELLTGVFPGTQRPGFVYLPPGFDRSRRYPVVYLLHGLPGSPDEYVGSLQIGQVADAAIAAGQLRPFIAVLPAAGSEKNYDGEWAGPWDSALVDRIVPWVDANLPTVAGRSGRIIAGLSAGGYGAVNIALRHPSLFASVESWSGYFKPLPDGPFKDADAATKTANDPRLLAVTNAATVRRSGMRFLVSTGPGHSRWFTPQETVDFASELKRLGIPVSLKVYAGRKGQWRRQFDAGLAWALGR